MMHFASLAMAALLGLAQALDVQVVAVGKNPSNNKTALQYFPDKVTAKAGTMVQFQFWAGNHTVTQSSFDSPCMPLAMSAGAGGAAGIYSSFMPAAASQKMGEIPVFTVMVNDTKPIWVYCSQGKHCQEGMVMVINENTSANSSRSLDSYKKSASNAAGGMIPGSSAGGQPSNDGNSGKGGSSTGGSPATTSAPVSAASGRLAMSSSLLVLLGAGFAMLLVVAVGPC